MLARRTHAWVALCFVWCGDVVVAGCGGAANEGEGEVGEGESDAGEGEGDEKDESGRYPSSTSFLTLTAQEGGGQSALSATIADVDGDGLEDVVSASFGFDLTYLFCARRGQ